MKTLDQTVYACIEAMQQSDDYMDSACISAFDDIINIIISNPSIIIKCSNKEHLSLIMSGIYTSGYIDEYQYKYDINIEKLVFAVGYYLFMYQLDTGTFYDRNWGAFILLLHEGRDVFADYIAADDPSSQGSVYNVLDIMSFNNINKQKWTIVKGIELKLLIYCQQKGYDSSLMKPWLNELKNDSDNLLSEDYFKERAIPLYRSIGDNLSNNDLSFVEVN